MISRLTLVKVLTGLVLLSALLLYLPAIWYSLNTHFGLVDDYNAWNIVRDFSSWPGAFNWMALTLWDTTSQRFRPMFDIYNLVTWSLFGERYAIHHLARLLIKAASCFFSILAILRYASHSTNPKSANNAILLFAILYAFFPNTPEARLGPQETLVVLFLSISLFALFRQLYAENGNSSRNIFFACFSLLCLSLSKETAIPLSLCIHLYFVLVLLSQKRKRDAFIVSLAFLLQIWAIFRTITVIGGGGYGVQGHSTGLLKFNLEYYFTRLFLLESSLIYGILFLAVPSSFFLFKTLFSFIRLSTRLFVDRTLRFSDSDKSTVAGFIVILLWILSYAISIASWQPVLRYGYPTAYLLCLVLSLAVTHIIHGAAKYVIPLLCIIFMVLNAYNFMNQYGIQYAARRSEAKLLTHIKALLDNDQKVASIERGEITLKLDDYFNHYLPFYAGYTKNIALISSPKAASRHFDYYVCPRDDRCRANRPPKGFVLHKRFIPRTDLLPLEVTKKISAILSTKPPFREMDSGSKLNIWLVFRRAKNRQTTQQRIPR